MREGHYCIVRGSAKLMHQKSKIGRFFSLNSEDRYPPILTQKRFYSFGNWFENDREILGANFVLEAPQNEI